MSERAYSGAAAAVVALLEASAREGVELTRTKVAKLLYLADLRAVEDDLRPASGLPWIWYNYGPWANVLTQVEDALVRDGVADRTTGENYYGSKQVWLSLRSAPQYEIDARFAAIVAAVVHDFGRLTPSSLKDLTYATPPMIEAQKGNRGVRLDLEGQRPVRSLGTAMKRLARHRLGVKASDAVSDEVREGLLAEHAEWRGSIANVNLRHVL